MCEVRGANARFDDPATPWCEKSNDLIIWLSKFTAWSLVVNTLPLEPAPELPALPEPLALPTPNTPLSRMDEVALFWLS